MTYAEKLRLFADYLDNHPVVAQGLEGEYTYPNVSVYCPDWDNFQAVCADLNGYSKSRYGATLEAKHTKRDKDDSILYSIDVNVSNVCERVPKVDDAGEPVMKPRMQYVDTGEMEQEYEWNCPPVWSDK